MDSTVFANGMGISHAGSTGKTIASAPDVCKTTCGPVVVPIPYPNMAESANVAGGSATVKIGGNMVAVKGCNYAESTGNESGDQKGVVSGKIQAKAEFTNYSMDVKIEGNNVCRNGDMTTNNEGNTVGSNMDSSGAPPESSEGEEDTVTLELELYNEDNEPIGGARYIVYDENEANVAEGTLDENGYALITDLQPVRHHVEYPEIENSESEA